MPEIAPSNPRELKFTCVFVEYLEDLDVGAFEKPEWGELEPRGVFFDVCSGHFARVSFCADYQ